MPTREEIREGIQDILTRYGNFMDGYDADSDVLDIDEALEAILSYLHSQGVVIKVDRELPESMFVPGFGYMQGHSIQAILDVAIEPLIKEE